MKILLDKTTKYNYFFGIGWKTFYSQRQFRIYIGKYMVIFLPNDTHNKREGEIE